MNKIILASGSQTRWQEGLKKGLPLVKSLISINGHTLIEDIQNKFPGAEVCTSWEAIQNYSEKWFAPFQNRWLLETLYWTFKHWGTDSTLILLGDVFYGKETIKKISEFKGKYMFYGNSTDLIALYFEREFNDFLFNALRLLVTQCVKRVHQGKLWHLYRFTQAIPFNKHEIKDNITIVHDSRDFDNCEQYLKFISCQKKNR